MLTNLNNIREQRFELENQYLSEYATKSAETKGRARYEEPCPIRTEFQRDRDKIIHGKAFRRLKHKTQVFISPEEDHYRTRMTHTLEVAQISRTIARALRFNEDLTEAIALGHDLGHTPFGHAGELVLDELIEGGFRHNEQSVRILSILEDKNLTAETLDGILNHTGPIAPFTLEGQIVKISDRIAYLNHDIDDATRAGIIDADFIPERCKKILGNTHSERITTMVTDIIENSYGKNEIIISEEKKYGMDTLREWMFKNVYIDSPAKVEEHKACKLIKDLFYYFIEHPQALDKSYTNNGDSPERQAVDYVASMTDRFAIKIYKEKFIPFSWSGSISKDYIAEVNLTTSFRDKIYEYHKRKQ